MTIIVSDNFFSLIKSATNHFLNLKFKSVQFNAFAEPRVGFFTQDGRMGYLSSILYLREGTSLSYNNRLVPSLRYFLPLEGYKIKDK